ncbi:MAG: OmpL47-type beta-barrel domain-containing protein, partial [Thermoplasmata archaeon]
DAPQGNDTHTRVDTESPSTIAEGPFGWSTVSPVVVVFNASDTGSGIHTTYFQVDGGPWNTGTNVSVSGDGTHTVSFYSTDSAGNQEVTKTVTVMIDATAPFSSVNPLPTHENSLIFSIYFTAYDSVSGIASVELLYGVGGESYQVYGNFTSSPIGFVADREGNYRFVTCAWDKAGNREEICPPTIPDSSTTVRQVEGPATQSSINQLFGILLLLVLLVLALSVASLFFMRRWTQVQMRKADLGEIEPEGPEAPTSPEVSCSWCMHPTDPGASFCSNCGGYVGGEVLPSREPVVREESMTDEIGGGR